MWACIHALHALHGCVPLVYCSVHDPCFMSQPKHSQEDQARLASHAAASTSKASSSSSSRRDGDFTSPQQRALFSLFDSYADVFHAAKPYPGGPGWMPGRTDEVGVFVFDFVFGFLLAR